jgi:hypothetical protein
VRFRLLKRKDHTPAFLNVLLFSVLLSASQQCSELDVNLMCFFAPDVILLRVCQVCNVDPLKGIGGSV